MSEVRSRKPSFQHSNTCNATSHVLESRPAITQWIRKFNRPNFKLHRNFFFVSYQLLLVTADNSCFNKNESQSMWAPFSFFFGPTSLCINAPSPKTNRGEREFFFEGRGQLYTGKGLLDMDFPSSVMENNAVLWRMQGCIKNLSNFIKFLYWQLSLCS